MRRTAQLALLALLALIVLSAPAAAERPSELQYGNHVNGEEPPPAPEDGDVGAPSGGLPFTGLEAGIVLLGGFAAVASGFALRRPRREEALGVELAPLPLAALTAPPPPRVAREMARCATCGNEFDPRRYQVMLPSVPGIAGVFDSIDCAVAASERGLAAARA